MATRQSLYGAKASGHGKTTDPFYTGYLSVRAHPVTAFMGRAPPKWALPITSVNEDKLLKLLGLTATERSQIEGLLETRRPLSSSGTQLALGLSVEQQMTRARVRLATNPPSRVGDLQRRTQSWLLRP